MKVLISSHTGYKQIHIFERKKNVQFTGLKMQYYIEQKHLAIQNVEFTEADKSLIPSKTPCGKRQNNISQYQKHHQRYPCEQLFPISVVIWLAITSQTISAQPKQPHPQNRLTKTLALTIPSYWEKH